jgi:cell division protein FtsL
MRLFAKLLVIVVALGATALGLLALRQQRYEVSNEISRTHNRIVEQERAQWRMRAQVAARSTPADIRKAAERQGIDLAPVQESGMEATAPAKPAAKGASRGR